MVTAMYHADIFVIILMTVIILIFGLGYEMKKYFALSLLAVMLVFVTNVTEAQAAAIDYPSLDLLQGFNFNADVQTPMGYITSLTLGGLNLTADIQVMDFSNPLTTRNVVGVMKSINWSGGHSDAINFVVQITANNKQQVAQLLHQGLTDTSVQFHFDVYDYDPIAMMYYKAFNPVSWQA